MTPIAVDRYEILGVLGEGGTGIVYDAIRTADRKPIALKVMHDRLAGDAQIRGRFQREAAILRRLDGEHVCPILEFGELPGPDDRGLLYLALPKIEGRALAQILTDGLIDIKRAIDIMLQVLEALTYAHERGIVHRDLKPANVLLDANEKAFVVDFGMSKIVTGGGLGTTNLTTHNMLFGTPEYMSPEQARGDELDARCDVYAAGVMLYEMLTGAPPFQGETPLIVLTAHLTSDLEPPSSRPNGASRVTPALESVVLHALARDPAERYASAREFARALKQAHTTPDDVESVRPSALSNARDALRTGTTENPPRTSETMRDEGRPLELGSEADRTTARTPLPESDRAPSTSSTSDTVVDGNALTLADHRQRASTLASRIESSSRRAATMANLSRSTAEKTDSREHDRVWLLVWIAVAVASIAVGVYIALRT